MNTTFEGTKALNEYLGEEVFPLFSIPALADRWKVQRHNIENWRARHEDFPKPIEGIVNGVGSFYPLYAVKRYEQARGLK